MKGAAVLYVKDLRRMQPFYLACFSMDIADDAEDYCVLESASLTLSLVVVPERIAATISVSVPPVRRAQVPIKLAFPVESIDALRPLVAELGGSVDPATTQREFRGSKLCDGIDPEGNVIQLLEPITHPLAGPGAVGRAPSGRWTLEQAGVRPNRRTRMVEYQVPWPAGSR